MNKGLLKSTLYSNSSYIVLFVLLYIISISGVFKPDPVFNENLFYFDFACLLLLTVGILIVKINKISSNTLEGYFTDILFSFPLFGLLLAGFLTIGIVTNGSLILILTVFFYILFCLIISYMFYYFKNVRQQKI